MTTSLGAFSLSSGQASIMGLLKGGTAFACPNIASLGAVQGSFSTLAGHMTALGPTGAAGLLAVGAGLNFSAITAIAGRFAAVSSGALTDMGSHMASQMSGLVDNLSLYTSHLGVQQGLKDIGSSLSEIGSGDVCAGLSDFLGSTLSLGASVISGISGIIGSVVSAVSGLINDVTTAINTVTQATIDAISATVSAAITGLEAAAATITTMIANEIAAAADALANMLSFGNMHVTCSLFKNPCAKQALSVLATPALASALATV